MAYEAKRTTVGFEFLRSLTGWSQNPVPYELKPNTAFAKGELVVMIAPYSTEFAGKIVPATSSSVVAGTRIVGVMAETIAAADNPATGLTHGLVYDNPFNVYRVSFADHYDGTAAGTGTTTTLDTGVTSTTENILRGALLYIYEGPGAGEVRTISSNNTSGVLTWINAIAAATTAATKFILLAYDNSGFKTGGINVGSRGVHLNTSKLVDAKTVPSATGMINVLNIDPENLWMDVTVEPGTGYPA